MLAAQQLIDRHAQRFADDIVQGDVDGALRGQQHPAALKVLAAIQLLPDAPALHGVLADEELAVVVERAHHRQLAAAQARLAQARNAGIGLATLTTSWLREPTQTG